MVSLTGENKAFIFRYYADTSDEYLCDDGVIADPDFFTNRHNDKAIPTWSICGVYNRPRLHEGDRVFFVPTRQRLERLGFGYYICTGVLVVKQVLAGKEDLLNDPRLSERYKEMYEKDLRSHRKTDKKRNAMQTRDKRSSRIIIGNPEESIWFGRNETNLQCLLADLDMSEVSRALPRTNNMNLPTLTSTQSTMLYEYLRKHIPAIIDAYHNHLGRKSDQACLGCRPK